MSTRQVFHNMAYVPCDPASGRWHSGLARAALAAGDLESPQRETTGWNASGLDNFWARVCCRKLNQADYRSVSKSVSFETPE